MAEPPRLVACLDLGRPGSVSVAGAVGDATQQPARWPAPMMFQPARNSLVTLDPAHLSASSGVERMHALDRLSSPKHHRAKSPLARHRLQHDQAQQQLQQRQPVPWPSQHAAAARAARLQASSCPASLRSRHAPPAPQPHSSTAGSGGSGTGASGCSEWHIVTAPHTFLWGGRLKSRHSALARMASRDVANAARAAGATRRGSGGALQQPGLAAAGGVALDPQTAAAAAVLCAGTNRLLAVLDARRAARGQQLQPQPQPGQLTACAAGGGWHEGAACADDAGSADAPVGLQVEYLRL